jgi:beta-phosphoglucomutase
VSAMDVRAIAFDFNGTLSDDEPVLLHVYQELFAELGRPLTEAEYYEQLAGHTDEDMLIHWFGKSDPAVIEERVARYNRLAADGSTVDEETKAALRFAAGRVPVAIVSAALRHEIDVVVEGAGIGEWITLVVSQDDVENGKPHPECYLRAAELLGVEPAQLLVFEDTDVGVSAAKAAGTYVVALTRTVGAERVAHAHELAERIDVATLERLCS